MIFIKLLIVGSRKITDFDLSPYVTDDVGLIISGGAVGVDTLAEKFADRHGISKLILRPHYSRYGRLAPLIRNDEMVALADAVLAVWDGSSRGTRHTIEAAKCLGKRVTVIEMRKTV